MKLIKGVKLNIPSSPDAPEHQSSPAPGCREVVCRGTLVDLAAAAPVMAP